MRRRVAAAHGVAVSWLHTAHYSEATSQGGEHSDEDLEKFLPIGFFHNNILNENEDEILLRSNENCLRVLVKENFFSENENYNDNEDEN